MLLATSVSRSSVSSAPELLTVTKPFASAATYVFSRASVRSLTGFVVNNGCQCGPLGENGGCGLPPVEEGGACMIMHASQ